MDGHGRDFQEVLKRQHFVKVARTSCEYVDISGEHCGREAEQTCSICGMRLCNDCTYTDPIQLASVDPLGAHGYKQAQTYCYDCLLTLE